MFNELRNPHPMVEVGASWALWRARLSGLFVVRAVGVGTNGAVLVATSLAKT
jgi:hypothetical protein